MASVLSTETLYEGIRNGNRRLLAKAISVVESTRIDDTLRAQALIEKILPHTGNAFRLGITGVPGAGKSTFIEALGLYLCGRGLKVAVLAIDPSSERTGGAILGDKTRMLLLAREKHAFIRPAASSGTLGGIARKTRETMLLCEAAGYDVIIIETVGVGQSETAVARLTDFFLAIMLANTGDELQGIKRGIMEMCDAIVVNKADLHREQAQLTQRRLQAGLHLLTPKYRSWEVPVLLSGALHHEGIVETWAVCENFRRVCAHDIAQLRTEQAGYWMHDTLMSLLQQQFFAHPAIEQYYTEYEQKARAGIGSPTALALRLVEMFHYKQKE
jgi:LAO/AO transport system kinase